MVSYGWKDFRSFLIKFPNKDSDVNMAKIYGSLNIGEHAKLQNGNAIRVRDFVFISGHLLNSEDLSEENSLEQFRQCLGDAIRTFADNGADLSDIVKLNVYVNEKYRDRFHQAYGEVFSDFQPPLTVVQHSSDPILQIDGIAIIRGAPPLSYLRDPRFWRVLLLGALTGLLLPVVVWLLFLLFSLYVE